jgi:hypothetical protein
MTYLVDPIPEFTREAEERRLGLVSQGTVAYC